MGVKSALKAASKLKGKGGTRYMTAAEREKALARKKERMQNANKRRTTSAQRTYGKGRAVGKSTGRKQGAAAGLGAGLTVAAIREMTNASELKKLEKENLSLAQKAAIRETLLKIASEEAAKPKRTVPRTSQSPKPKLRPKMKAGGSVEPAWLKSMKKEADKLGLPLRELLTKYNGKGGSTTRDKYGPQKPKAKGKKASMMRAAKGGYSKKKK